MAAIRILVDPNDPKDVEQVDALQDAVKVEQPRGPGSFEMPNWDRREPEEGGAMRCTVLGATLPDWRGAAGRKDEVDPVRHLIVTATGWGLNPEKDAIYLNVVPSKNDGKTIYKLNVKGCARRRLLVDHPLQRRRISREERSGRLFAQQHHGEKECGRLGHCPVRRLRWQGRELPSDLSRLELHGAPLSAAQGNSRRHMEVSRGTGREVRDRNYGHRSFRNAGFKNSCASVLREVDAIRRRYFSGVDCRS